MGDVRSRAEEHHHAVFLPLASLYYRPRECWILGVHQRMRKAHFGPIDGTTPCGLDDGEQVMVFRVEDDALGGDLLLRTRSEMASTWPRRPVSGGCRLESNLQGLECGGHGASAIRGDVGGWREGGDDAAMRQTRVRSGRCTARSGDKKADSTASGDGSRIGARLTARVRRMGKGWWLASASLATWEE